MRPIVFIDTSILCNVVPVPGRDQHATEVLAEMAERLRSGHNFILPITAVIETGNFIAQLPGGSQRRAAAMRLSELLRLVCEGKAPWVLHDLAWNRSFLVSFLAGSTTGMTYVEHAQSQLGAGDLCILTERDHYRERTGIHAQIWARDAGLMAFN